MIRRLPARRLRRLLGVLAVTAACGPEIPDPIWKGEHLHYGTTTDAPICRGSFFRQEQHAVEMARMLGFELSGVINYTRTSPSEIGEYCHGQSNLGCQYDDGGRVLAFSTLNVHFHEIAHAVGKLADFTGARPFTEGFAEVFSDGISSFRERIPIADAVRHFVLDRPYFYTMGLFARFLIERHGLGSYVEFLRATEFDDDYSQISDAFTDVFGESIDFAMAEFDAYPSCAEMSNRIAAVDCNLPLEPWNKHAIEITADIACDREDVLGPVSGGYIYTTRAFEVHEAGLHLVWPQVPEEGLSFFRLVKCGSCWDRYDKVFLDDEPTLADLTPGRYYVILARHIDDEPAQIGIFISDPDSS